MTLPGSEICSFLTSSLPDGLCGAPQHPLLSFPVTASPLFADQGRSTRDIQGLGVRMHLVDRYLLGAQAPTTSPREGRIPKELATPWTQSLAPWWPNEPTPYRKPWLGMLLETQVDLPAGRGLPGAPTPSSPGLTTW